MTLAPPPATIVQIRPIGFNTVNFKDALVWEQKINTNIISVYVKEFIAP